MRGMSPASLILSALLACFGVLVSAQDLPPGSCPETNQCDDTVLLSQLRDCCNFFSFCSDDAIPHRPAECLSLKNDDGTWTPASCTAGPNNIGASCKLQCNHGYQLRGSSSIQCTDKGWNSVNGNVIPKCVPEECIGEDIDNDLNKTLSGKVGILFVLDESGSVTLINFQRTKAFVKDVVQKYPLSESRSAGVITFASSAVVKIHLNVDSTSDFLKAVDGIGYNRGGTSILAGLQLAVDEIDKYSKHDFTVVVLITDGVSETDGTPAADILKKASNPIFAIGIDKNNNLVHLELLSSTGENGIKHFFHVTSYEALEIIGKFINPPAGSAGSGGPKDRSKCKN